MCNIVVILELLLDLDVDVIFASAVRGFFVHTLLLGCMLGDSKHRFVECTCTFEVVVLRPLPHKWVVSHGTIRRSGSGSGIGQRVN